MPPRESRPHVCFVAPHAYPVLAEDDRAQFIGGAELQQVLVARELARRGYRVSMICLDFGQDDRCEIDGIVVHRAFRPDAGLPVLRFFWPRLTSLWRCLGRVDADIYYQRGASMLTGVVAEWCRRHGRPSVFAMAGATKIRFRRDRWLFRHGLENVDRIVVQNLRQSENVLEETGRQPALIPNVWKIAAAPRAGAGGSVLWVSTIRKVKRPELFLALAGLLPERRFTMVGGRDLMDRPLYDQVEAHAGRLSNVEFAGFVPYRDVHRYFDEAALFVNTSESEGFPNTFLQAWERGIPTVSFIDAGARVDGRPPGSIVGSLDEMAAAVDGLLSDDERRSTLGGTCRKYAEENHGMDHVIGLYERLFGELMASRSIAGRQFTPERDRGSNTVP